MSESKKRRVDFQSPERQPKPLESTPSIDWELCFICQTRQKDNLQFPAANALTNVTPKESYDNLASSIKKLHSIGELPIPLDIKNLECGISLGESLLKNDAKYHRKCKKKFDADKIQRATTRHEQNKTEYANDAESSRSNRRRQSDIEEPLKCFFCEKPEEKKRKLHKAQTYRLDAKVRRAAKDTNASILYAKLENGDMCAQDALYHSDCLCKLYREATRARMGEDINDNDRKLHGLAFSKVLSYIDETLLASNECIPVFKLAELSKYYSECIQELGIDNYKVHSTRLKQRIMGEFEDMYAQTQGRDVILGFRGDLGEIISTAANIDYDNEGIIIAEACKIFRRDLLQMENTVFNGKFDQQCQANAIPESIKCLLSSTMHANHTSNPHYKQAVLTIGQLIRFNTLKRARSSSTSMYHSIDREPPLPIYLSEMIHSKTRSMEMVDRFAHLGLSISKDRLLQMSTSLGNAAIDTFKRDGVVVPMYLRKGLFCTSAVDNIDINPRSSTAKTSLHGTAASINQHSLIDSGAERETVDLQPQCTTLKQLPDHYTEIIPLHLPALVLPAQDNLYPIEEIPLDADLEEDKIWLDQIDQPSWAVFHARRETQLLKLKEDISALLPIWRDDSKSPATIKHALDVIKRAIEFLNPGQMPVTTLDQPLYAIAKRLQWYFPNNYGTSKFVMILGALHIEMAMLSTMGDWFEGSGWLNLLSNANVTSPGNQFLLTGHEVAKSKYVHQVTASVLYRLMKSSYDGESGERTEEDENMEADESQKNEKITFDSWRADMEVRLPQFQYWSIALKLEMAFFLFARSIRSRNFILYKYAIDQLLPWMFALDHVHYARWLSIHLYDMQVLNQTSPDTYYEFKENGNFVVARTKNRFSSMGIDHRHEQLNADVKGNASGAVGLTEEEEKFLRWMICGPEEARIVREFEAACVLQKFDSDNFRHHEDSSSFQRTFKQDVEKLEAEFRTLGNPFDLTDTSELIQLATYDVMDEAVMKTIQTIEQLGHEQKTAFMNMLCKYPASFEEPIKKNKLPLFRNHNTKSERVRPSQETKDQLHLISQLFVATQVRGGDMDEFFSHETLVHPPSLSKSGQLRSGEKAEILPQLKNLASDSEPAVEMPAVDAVVLEGSVLANQIKPNKNQTFSKYAEEVFFPVITRYKKNSNASRVDVVYDTYPDISLKGTTRGKRGPGLRRKVHSTSVAPTNWKSFLRSSENKTELFRFLSTEISKHSHGEIISAFDNTVTCTVEEETALLCPTNHEEGDTRVFLHVKDMAAKGFRRVMIRTVDTDVLVLAISLFEDLGVTQLWIDFGSGKHRVFLPIHDMDLEEIKRIGLRFFYCFTGCDQVSFFAHVSKKTAWKVWEVFPSVSEAFASLSNQPTEAAIEEALPILERFVVLLYHRTSNCTSVNECRRELFCNGRACDNIPPTQAALLQHVKRAAFISGHVWAKSLLPMQDLPAFEEWGWKEDGKPYWTELPEASRGVRQLIKCGCKKGCKTNCKCNIAMLPCTELCVCKGSCRT